MLSHAPEVVIFVRHSAGCPNSADETFPRCNCRKHFRWTMDGRQYRQSAKTRSWKQAEANRARLIADLVRDPATVNKPHAQTISGAVGLFKADKKNANLTAGVEQKYARELARLEAFCEARNIFTVPGITRELLIEFCATWPESYPSTITRLRVLGRLRSFLKFSFESKWIDRVPRTATIKADEPPTLPLTDKEYRHLIATITVSFPDPAKARRVRALVQLMRWSGLAIRDAVTLRRDEISLDKGKKLYRIVTARQKTGTHVSVPIPPAVAKEILTVLNGNPTYVFWTGNGLETSAVTNWQHDLRALFRDAGITSEGHMLSHRLRDTFAVDLLTKGVPMEEVSKLLGHESIKTTERSYAAWAKGRQDRLDKLVTGTWRA